MSDLRRMRMIATGALILMAGVYVAAKILQQHAAVWGYVAAKHAVGRATGEA